MNDPAHPEDSSSKGLLYCFVLVVFAVSLVGFLTGIGSGVPAKPRQIGTPHEPVEKGKVAEARSYKEMRKTPRGTGSGWEQSLEVAALSTPRLKLTQETLDQALRQRQTRRAYDGAPPTIPHHVRQNSAAECLSCHGEGLRLGSLQAGTLPHDNFTNCTQCHVTDTETVGGLAPASEKALGVDPRAVENSFSGTFPAKKGARAWSIAPPEVPHNTFMRQNCLSCHGNTGSAPMRSSHTERQNCVQCHAISAQHDLRPGTELPPRAHP